LEPSLGLLVSCGFDDILLENDQYERNLKIWSISDGKHQRTIPSISPTFKPQHFQTHVDIRISIIQATQHRLQKFKDRHIILTVEADFIKAEAQYGPWLKLWSWTDSTIHTLSKPDLEISLKPEITIESNIIISEQINFIGSGRDYCYFIGEIDANNGTFLKNKDFDSVPYHKTIKSFGNQFVLSAGFGNPYDPETKLQLMVNDLTSSNSGRGTVLGVWTHFDLRTETLSLKRSWCDGLTRENTRGAVAAYVKEGSRSSVWILGWKNI